MTEDGFDAHVRKIATESNQDMVEIFRHGTEAKPRGTTLWGLWFGQHSISVRPVAGGVALKQQCPSAVQGSSVCCRAEEIQLMTTLLSLR